MKLHIYHEDRPWEQSANFWIVAEMPDGSRQIAEPMSLVFKPIDEGLQNKPTLKFSGQIALEFFPALQDAMIRSGYLRPKKDEAIESIKYHLEDMRKLVFKKD